jgi:hypothetical protein
MSSHTLWGAINANGTIASSSGGFSVSHQGTGQYVISFRTLFQSTPSIVGSQTNYGALNQNPLDNVVFPFVDTGSATVLTGASNGSLQDRNFSFIAIGNAGAANPKFKE